MSLIPRSRSYSRRSVGVLLVVGVLAGVTVGGGVGVIAATAIEKVTVCANKTTNVLRYAKNGKCVTTETKVVLNQSGDKGDMGAPGADGAKGAKGDKGAPGADGVAGAPGTVGATGAAGSSSPTGFTARSVCGSDGTTLCAVGVQGPGGGLIFYVDTDNEMPGYDYLEAAPADASAIVVVWSTTTTRCGPDADISCRLSFIMDAGSTLKYLAVGTGREATAAIVARHNAGGVAKSSYAAGVADAYTTATASDWFLPSKDELALMYTNLRAATVPLGGLSAGYYLSSSENVDGTAFGQNYQYGEQLLNSKDYRGLVRPVRAF